MAASAWMFKKGDVIGGYELHSALGRGGFGEVYLAYNRSAQRVCALKTIRTELLADVAAKQAFKKEALLWVELDEHPFIVTAREVHEFSGRLFVEMDHVAPDAWERVSLADHLISPDESLNLDRVLTWAIEFCCGMDHANRHGLKCHRDIKPSNILITQDGTLKISDFGLGTGAEALSKARTISFAANRERGSFGFSFVQHDGKGVCGTPGYIAPEIILGEEADVRSDVYSFGLVLWQMVARSPVPPFHAPHANDVDAYIREVFQQQMRGHVPQGGGRVQWIIERCLMPDPSRRPENFELLQKELDSLLRERTGRSFQLPQTGEQTAGFWNDKGVSLLVLGQYEEAIACFRKDLLQIDPRDPPWRSAGPWFNMGLSLRGLGKFEEAASCFSRALDLAPSPRIWTNKGLTLHDLGRFTEGMECFSEALKLDPKYGRAWYGKGLTLAGLGDLEESVVCLSKALEIEPRDEMTWYNLGVVSGKLGRREEAIACYSKALEINPLHSISWNNKGMTLSALGQHTDALSCFSRALEIDPLVPGAWTGMGIVLLWGLGRADEALSCFSKAVEVDPHDALAWRNKGITEGWFLGDRKSGVLSLQKFLHLARGIASESNRIKDAERLLAEWMTDLP